MLFPWERKSSHDLGSAAIFGQLIPTKSDTFPTHTGTGVFKTRQSLSDQGLPLMWLHKQQRGKLYALRKPWQPKHRDPKHTQHQH